MSEEALLQRMHRAGQQAWPSLPLSFEHFAHHCARIFRTGLMPGIEARAGDLFLCCACASGNPRAAELFAGATVRVATIAIRRVNADPEFVRETVQQLWDKLLFGARPSVAEYSGRGELGAWVRISAARLALDGQRKARREVASEPDLFEALIDREQSLESGVVRHRYAADFQRALSLAVSQLSVHDRALLRMHLHARCSIDQIGRAYRVHRATAARWLHSIRTAIFDSVRQEVQARNPRLSDAEFVSLAGSLARELDLGLSRHAAEAQSIDEGGAPGQPDV